ncbi:aldehyde dehydrogenase [Novosphingobium malaysiense]|uniref:Aldehyde dehydrogenase n=1 Tax=Novosphingobium malaysiense TaxID=1348853 RepID=A0A0B1ZST8_9SPHN|nr:aldehyde dehydrogenase [Novosphingobium malaysiense]
MRESLQFYIDGAWVDPIWQETLAVENPAIEKVCGHVALGSATDVDRAVRAARQAFGGWSASSREERIAVLQSIAEEYRKRADDLAAAVTEEMGAPVSLAQNAQVPLALAHLSITIEVLKSLPFAEDRGATRVAKEPIGVCGLITPWNWPLNQIAVKVFPAIAAGCTMVLKPSEVAPFSAQIFAEIMDAAGLPPGVFNMVQGDGPGVGVALSSHPDVDMVSFTGSTRAGIEIARNAAPTVKRVCQELGGKSPNIILDDEAFAEGVSKGIAAMMGNSGQTCAAPTRMLVPHTRMDEAIAIAADAASAIVVGDPQGNAQMGPVVSRAQFDKIQGLIRKGIEEGATLVSGGPGRPEGLETGYYVKPTVFAHVDNGMAIAREEIFGPVLAILGYDSVDQAVGIANDTEYGLAAYVHAHDLDKGREIAARLRAGLVSINQASDLAGPFGGYKRSGNGREWGAYGIDEYLETKAIIGYAPEMAD